MIHASEHRPPNQAPGADGGEDQTIYLGDRALLRGTATDPDGDPIVAWYWTLEDRPEESGATLRLGDTPDPYFDPDVVGDYLVSLQVSDGTTLSAPDAVVIHVNDPNQAPVAEAGEDQAIYLGDRAQLRGTATDPDGDPIVAWYWTVADGPAASRAALQRPDSPDPYFEPDWVGDYLITLEVSDGATLSAPDPVVIHVSEHPLNQVPTANAGEDQSIYLRDRARLHGTATDPDGDPIVAWYWTLEEKPEGSTATLSRSGIHDPYFDPDMVGDYLLSLQVSDGATTSAPDGVVIHVNENPPNQAPIADAGEDQSILLRDYARLDGRATDPDGDPIVRWDWNVAEIPPGGSGFILSGRRNQNARFCPGAAGDYRIILEVSDGALWSAPDEVVIHVSESPPNQAPIANAGEDQSVYLGDRVQLEGTATDPDDDLIVAWLWTMEHPIPYFDPDVVGDYIIRFVVSDGCRQSEPDFILIHVAENLPPTAVIVADVTTGSAPLTVHFDGTQSFDPEGSPLSFRWDFDGPAEPYWSTDPAPTTVYRWPGTFYPELLVIDDRGQRDLAVIQIEVTLPGSTPAGTDVEVTPPDETTGEPSGVTITFDEVDGSGETTVSTSGSGTPPPEGFRLGQPPVYYEVTTTATFSGSIEICIDYSGQEFPNEQNLRLFHDTGNGWEDVTSSHDLDNDIICGIVTSLSPFLMASENTVPVASAGGPYTGDEGSAVAVSFLGSDEDGDALVYAWDLGDGTTGTGETPPTAHTYLDNGTYAITLTASDAYGGTQTAATVATITNVAPSVGPVTAASEPVAVGTGVTVGAEFTDPGINDSHTADIEWGDGSRSPAIVSETGGRGSVTGAAHSYATAGVYTLKVMVTDNDGDMGESVYEFVVVYDPSGGFVTGGGWIDSEPGAYRPDPSLGGKATFGFVSKYTRGTEVPTGNTEFQFRAGGLNFHSTSYQWLVVTGSEYARFKGSGTINGMGEYNFMLWAGDGSPDTFRIRIWEEDEATAVETDVYDNGFDQAIGGGSIVVHTR